MASSIKKVIFQACTNNECVFSKDSYALITQQTVELCTGNAVAISYTWGEYNRRDVPVGHLSDGSPVTFCLGEEWVTSDFATRLQEICLESGGCWIDQICIPQKDEEIRATLAVIPDIYRTLDVIVLLPSAPCKCFVERANEAHKAVETLELVRSSSHEVEYKTADEQMIVAWSERQTRCANKLPYASWFSRLWTRQELEYATNLRVVYATNKQHTCFPVEFETTRDCSLFHHDGDLHLLQPYLALAFKSSLEFTGSRAEAMEAIGRTMVKSLPDSLEAISDYLNVQGQMSVISSTCRFFSGTKLKRSQPSNADDNNHQKNLYAFMAKLNRLGVNRRAATKERHYVVAVWMDCPGYILPVEFKTINLLDLLDDALGQLEKNFGISPVSTAPAGLLQEVHSGSGIWQPSMHMRPGSIEHSGTVYGVLSTKSVTALEHKGFQLDRFLPRTTALSKIAQPFEQVFQGMRSATVFDAMSNLAMSWATGSTSGHALRWAMFFARLPLDDRTDRLGHSFRRGLIDCMDSGKVRSQWLGEDIGHYSIVYHMVTDMLGLDYDACQKAELVLAVSIQASCIGVLRPAAIKNVQNNVTIVMEASISGCIAYEAERIETSAAHVPIYRICGVWVPTRALALLNIDFVRRPYGKQGFVI